MPVPCAVDLGKRLLQYRVGERKDLLAGLVAKIVEELEMGAGDCPTESDSRLGHPDVPG